MWIVQVVDRMEQEVLDKIASIFQSNIQKELRKPRRAAGYYGEPKRGVSPPIASGNLLNQTKVYFEGSLETADLKMVVDFGNADYWYFVNYGRKPGRYPPIKPIDRWVLTKPQLSTTVRDDKGRFIPRKSLVFLFRRSLARYGYKATNFLDNAITLSIDQIVDGFGEAAFLYIEGLFDINIVSDRTRTTEQ